MIGSLVGEVFLREVPAQLVKGVLSGEYSLFGSVVRNTASGQIMGFLQEAAPLAPLVTRASMGPAGLALEAGGTLVEVVQNEFIRAGVARIELAVGLLQNLAVANLVIGGVGLGISVAGFAMMAARIDGVKRAVDGVADQIEQVAAKIDALQRDAIAGDFAELTALSKGFDEAWSLGEAAASRRWQDVARGALSQQSRFELRADRALSDPSQRYAMADPLLDALSLANALRVAALAACNESTAAGEAAADGSRTLERLTGGLGLADLSRQSLATTNASPGTLDWVLAQADANQTMRPIALKMRQREAAAATRAFPLAELEYARISPRDWMQAVHSEASSPILFMPTQR